MLSCIVYLHPIGKELTEECYHCDGEGDTTQHTLEQSPAWSEQRRALIRNVGQDLSLETIVRAIATDAGAWTSLEAY